jgi:SpoVK/Ycf46/Vps4 family AAA+-type ATPase
MSLRFRRRLRILPGIYINLGKNGISTTIGPRGANINIGKNGAYLNTGIPGTGISNRERLFGGDSGKLNSNNNLSNNTDTIPPIEEDNEINAPQEIITSEGLEGLKEHLEESRNQRELLGSEIQDSENTLNRLLSDYSRKKNGFFSLFTKKETINNLEQEINENTQNIDELKKHYEDSKADINLQLEADYEEQFQKLSSSFTSLTYSNKIWDITTEKINTELRSTAKSIVERKEVKFKTDSIDFIKSDYDALHLENANGSDLYIYPVFVLLINKQREVTLIDLKEINFDFQQQRFQEQEATKPVDAEIVDYTWYKANKDGSRDLRYVGNFQIPIVKYGTIIFNFRNKLSETYHVSNFELTQNFANDFKKYIGLFNYSSASNSQEELPNLIKPLLDSLDPLLREAATLIVTSQVGSTSLLQRRMKIGFNRAGRIMDQLEQLKIIGPNQGSTVRDVLVRDINTLTALFERYNDSSNDKIELENLNFSKQYYDLIVDFLPSLTEIREKLEADDDLNEKLKNAVNGITIQEFIQICIFYDCFQIVKIIGKEQVNLESLEVFGLVLLSGKIMEQLSSSSLAMDYENLNRIFSAGLQKDVAESIIKIVEIPNPLKISIQHSDNNKVISDKLSLTTALKSINDPLFDEYATVLYRFATIIAKANNSVSEEEENTLKDIYQITHNPISEDDNKFINISKVDEKETLDNVLNELETLIGLDSVKQEVRSLINYIKIQKEREKVGLKSSQISYHCVFTGSPGTGKTTIARIVAKIYLHLGILKKGHLVETDRSGLVAEYVGQTAVKVNKAIDSALDGVLFIDEAYSLVGENKDDFGKEAVATLIKRMEDDRDKLIVILAGYTNEMKDFIDYNPGLNSRFNRYIQFADYSPTELMAIFKLNCNKLSYVLTDEADKKLLEIITTAFTNRDKSFGNGRFARNIFEKTIEKQANRIASLPSLTKEILTTIGIDDLPVL